MKREAPDFTSIGVGDWGGRNRGPRLCSSNWSVLSRCRFAHEPHRHRSTLSTKRYRSSYLTADQGTSPCTLAARGSGELLAASIAPRLRRGRNVCGSPQREVFLSAPPNGLRAFTESPRTDAELQPTSNEGMGCEGEGRACSRGRAVVNTTPHGSLSRADPGLVGRGRAKLPRSRRGIFLPAARPARCLVRGAGWAPRTHELRTTQPARLAFRRGQPREPARPLVRRARSPVVPAPRARLSNCRPSSG